MEMLPRFARGGQPLMIGDQPFLAHWFAAGDLARIDDALQRLDVGQLVDRQRGCPGNCFLIGLL